ncbi:MAG TPA: hypothetical protein VMT62_10290 [Syntrophorhabdaceae bacterium]|nr:hypothetical protein [Syntrophorhabdaceae bacterium]
MIRTTCGLLLLLFLIAGCAITYTHPTKDAGDFERDRAACEAVAQKTLAVQGVT